MEAKLGSTAVSSNPISRASFWLGEQAANMPVDDEMCRDDLAELARTRSK
jgi:hypothetical protein